MCDKDSVCQSKILIILAYGLFVYLFLMKNFKRHREDFVWLLVQVDKLIVAEARVCTLTRYICVQIQIHEVEDILTSFQVLYVSKFFNLLNHLKIHYNSLCQANGRL